MQRRRCFASSTSSHFSYFLLLFIFYLTILPRLRSSLINLCYDDAGDDDDDGDDGNDGDDMICSHLTLCRCRCCCCFDFDSRNKWINASG